MELLYSRVFLPMRFEFPVIVELKVEGRFEVKRIKVGRLLALTNWVPCTTTYLDSPSQPKQSYLSIIISFMGN